MNVLEEIMQNTAREVADRKTQVSISELKRSRYYDRQILSLKEYLSKPDRSGIIAEIKKQSPSKGVINDQVDVTEVGIGYERAGASAISVLTDFKYFGGKPEYLTSVRENVSIPILRKDFMLDEYQITEARSIGADAILLIAAALTPERLKELAAFAKTEGLEVLMEVHNGEELENCICDDLDVIGVNNRNLKTFEVNVKTSLDLVDKIPAQFSKISESGLKDVETIRQLRQAGYNGFLIGETFMKTSDPAKALSELIRDSKLITT